MLMTGRGRRKKKVTRPGETKRDTKQATQLVAFSSFKDKLPAFPIHTKTNIGFIKMKFAGKHIT